MVYDTEKVGNHWSGTSNRMSDFVLNIVSHAVLFSFKRIVMATLVTPALLWRCFTLLSMITVAQN